MTPEPQPAGSASSVRTTCADLVFFMSAMMVGTWLSMSAASASVSARIHTVQSMYVTSVSAVRERGDNGDARWTSFCRL